MKAEPLETLDLDPQIEYVLKRVKSTKATQTYKGHKTQLKQFDRWLKEWDVNVLDATTKDLDSFLLDLLEDGYKSNTVENYVSSLSVLYGTLERFDEIEENPADDLDRSDYLNGGNAKDEETDLVYVTPEQMEQLAENVGTPKLRNELIIRMMWQTGVRRVELTRMKLENFDRENHRIRVWGAKKDKPKKWQEYRTVHYQPSLDSLLRLWIDGGHRAGFVHSEDSPYLFISRDSPQLHPQWVGDIVKNAAENAGIQEVMYEDKMGRSRGRITSHAIRHGHAVHAMKSGVNIRALQEQMGHEKITQTQQYLRFQPDDVGSAYERFGASD